MRFLVDNQLPPALVDFLKNNGHFAEHVSSLSFRPLSDEQIISAFNDGAKEVILDDET